MRPSKLAGTVPRALAWALIVGGLLATGGACLAAARGIEPVATWLYSFAWYPLLLALEGGVALRRGRFLLLGRPRLLLSVLAWSVPVWMLWEILNFRLENWYYVFVPDRRVALWAGVVISFATVLPACFLPAALVWPATPEKGADAGGVACGEGSRKRGGGEGASGRGSRSAGPELGEGALRTIRLAGAVVLLLPIVWPRLFFPLVWGGFVLLVEPTVFRAAPSRSLLADVVSRRWTRIGALLVGGALAGLAWESLNAVARGSWIYTVPGLEELKLFEMPPLGFFGFPPLALSGFALYQWLGLRGWSVPLRLEPGAFADDTGPSADARRKSWTGVLVRLVAGAVVVVTLLGMERWTISSRTPRLRDLPGLLPSDVETLRAWEIDSPFSLARAGPPALSGRIPGVEESEASRWVESARLATTRGMGTRNARLLHGWGIESLEGLARSDPDAVADCFRAVSGADVRPAQVRVWWRAARRRTGAEIPADRVPSC